MKKQPNIPVKFINKHRWTIEGNKLEPYYVKSVSFDWENSTINLTIYEVVLPDKTQPAMEWKKYMETNKERLKFTTYDEKGNDLGIVNFKNVQLTKIQPQTYSYGPDPDYVNGESVISFQLKYTNYDHSGENSSENSSSK